ncbi:protein arginine kinase, partial [Escherichia coli]|nr:protein arginine kinase [Escherichia coli]
MMTHNIHDNIRQWMKSNEETQIVMSSRIRIASNLENHVHPLMYATENDGFSVINEIQDALPNFELIRLA